MLVEKNVPRYVCFNIHSITVSKIDYMHIKSAQYGLERYTSIDEN